MQLQDLLRTFAVQSINSDKATLNGPAPRGHSYQHQRPSPAQKSATSLWMEDDGITVSWFQYFNPAFNMSRADTCRYVPGTSFLKPCSQWNTLLAHIFCVLDCKSARSFLSYFISLFQCLFYVVMMFANDKCISNGKLHISSII